MLTPQDVQNKEFSKAVFGGYDMTAVDNFLETITEDYSALFKENAILKSKIKVLVEKVEEYRSTEDSMRMALLTAQKMGDDLVEEANKKSAAIIADAENVFKARMSDAAKDIAVEEARLREAKRANAEFVEKSAVLLKAHAAFLDSLDRLEIAPAAPEKEPAAAPAAEPEKAAPVSGGEDDASIDDAVKQIDAVMSQLVADEEKKPAEPEATEAPAAQDDDDDEPVTPRPRFDFQNLQFGTNYSSGEGK